MLKSKEEVMKQIIELKTKKMFERDNKIILIPHRKVDRNRIKKLKATNI